MSVNPNWTRWVFASIATYLKQIAEEQNIPTLIAGLDEHTDKFAQASDRCEIKITGPFTRELSRNYYELSVDVQVLFNSRYDNNGKNRYDFHRILGVFHEAMDGMVAIYKYGLEPGDDEHAHIGCLAPRGGRNDSIRVLHFGQVTPVDRLRQSMVDARYVMYLDNNE